MAPQTLKEIREKLAKFEEIRRNQRANAKHYREKKKYDPEFIAKERERVRKWRVKNKKQID